jgi:hypothetical protein
MFQALRSHVPPAYVTTAKRAPNFHALARLGLLAGVEQETQRGACPRETVETVLGGGGRALGRRPLPWHLQRVARRLVTRRGVTSRVCLVGGRAPAPASACDGGPSRRLHARARSLRPGEKHACKLHSGASSVAGPRRHAAGRQRPCASPVPLREGLPPQRLSYVRCHQRREAGGRPLSPGGARRAGKPRACRVVQRTVAPTLPPRCACASRVVLAASDRPSPPTGRHRMNQEYQRMTQKSSK